MKMEKEKKKIVLYAIFACLVFATLAIFLVVNVFAKPVANLETEIYATEFDINSPNDININVNTQVEFKNLFKIAPSNYNQGIDFDITPKSYLSYCSFNLENKTFSASKIGSYYITFKVKTSQNGYKSETLKLTVKDKTDCLDIKQKINTANVGQTFDFLEVFEMLNDFEYEISVEDNSILTFSNNSFTANKVGKTNINVQIDRGYLTYFKVFPFEVTQNSLPEDKTDPEISNPNDKPTNPNEQETPPEDKETGDGNQNQPEHKDDNQGNKDSENENNPGKGDVEDNDKTEGNKGTTDGKTDNEGDGKEETKPNYEIRFSSLNIILGEDSIDYCIFEDNKMIGNQNIEIEILENDGSLVSYKPFSPTIFFQTAKQGKFKLKITSSFDKSVSFIVEFNVI